MIGREASGELSSPRGDASIDQAAVEDYLKARIPGLDVPMQVEQFVHGHANLTYLLRFADREYVLRRPPHGELPPGAHDMAREYNVLSRLSAGYDRAPAAVLFCDDPSVIGAIFVVIERRTGVVVRQAIPPELDGPCAPTRVADALVDALADLHAVDYEGLGLGGLGRPTGYVERQTRNWLKRLRAVDSSHAALLDHIGSQLGDSVPSSSTAAVLHNDFKLDNCQFAVGNPDRVASVFDWDMATLGDPMVDLGTLLSYWPDEEDPSAQYRVVYPQLTRLGLPSRAHLIRRYAHRTGFDVSSVTWHEAFGLWKLAIVSEQLYWRYKAGVTDDPRLGRRDQYVVPLAQAARATLEGHLRA
jgi:aminoglycoside phosphotransferase (APT) family kinase protein